MSLLIAQQLCQINHPQAEAHFATVDTFLSELEDNNITCPNLTVALISPPCQGFSAANPGGKDDNINRKVLRFIPFFLILSYLGTSAGHA